MKKCECVSCAISRALAQGKIPKGLSDMFLLGYHYYGMLHDNEPLDAHWHAEGVDYYAEEILSKDYPTQRQVKTLIKIIKNAKEQQ